MEVQVLSWAPEQNLTAFSKPEGGGRAARAPPFPPLFSKQFCPRIVRLLASFGKVRANHSACVKERSFLLRATSWKVTILIFQYDNLVRQLFGRETCKKSL